MLHPFGIFPIENRLGNFTKGTFYKMFSFAFPSRVFFMNVLEFFKKVTAFAFDIDGVLTDGTLYLMPDGAMVRRMNIKDGYALQLAIKMKYKIFIISGSDSPEAVARLQRLGVTEIFMQVEDKKKILTACMEKYGIQKDALLYMGDDIPDYEVMLDAGIACCPADAAKEIKSIAHYISKINGGAGCVRDVIEKVLQLNGNWPLHTKIKAQ